eukprot:2634043-Pyramimonas_sp.AAC.1
MLDIGERAPRTLDSPFSLGRPPGGKFCRVRQSSECQQKPLLPVRPVPLEALPLVSSKAETPPGGEAAALSD